MKAFLDQEPIVITALHLPELSAPKRPISVAWLEDYVLANLQVFRQGGIKNIMLQDETNNVNHAAPETIALMASLGRLARREFPDLNLGIIIQAHDPIAPLAVAHVMDAAFVRIKVFVGAMVKSEGVLEGCGVQASEYRHRLGRAQEIAILADVHDRTGVPLAAVPITMAAGWADRTGADALILTGRTYPESLQFLQNVRAAGVKRPLLMGGSVTAENVQEVLRYCNGVVVSTTFKFRDTPPEQLVLWDVTRIRQFMDAVGAAPSVQVA